MPTNIAQITNHFIFALLRVLRWENSLDSYSKSCLIWFIYILSEEKFCVPLQQSWEGRLYSLATQISEKIVIITSRVADAALFLGAMVFELGWNWNELQLLAQGSLAGHLLECGFQLTGGYYMHPGDKYRNMSLQNLFAYLFHLWKLLLMGLCL
ncbi:uncharacterized protein [Henckelia pumila]|uniref:uncharacterized protein n=1 Tax=Henckelia pumila TaxID=405737 RepID=UPI003C6DBB4A